MDYYVVNGGKRLNGTIRISGAKNAAVGILPAAILFSGKCYIDNLPDIEDVRRVIEIMKEMGASIEYITSNSILIDTTNVKDMDIVSPSVRKMRASYYFAGAMLGKYSHACVMLPGGCEIGERPIDQHIYGFEALGAKVKIEGNILKVEAEKLTGANIRLKCPSVGATINIMLAAVCAEGQTIIRNAAREPHVVDVANFLNAMGARVKGAGTDTIRITVPLSKHSSEKVCRYSLIPDQIEAGTFMIAAAAAGGEVIIRNIIPTHLKVIADAIMNTGAYVEFLDDGNEFFAKITASMYPASTMITTEPYPGFPTDLQQPMMAYLTLAKGKSMIIENIYENRFNHVPQLEKMGAKIKINDRIALVEGTDKLKGADLEASDLRAGAALIIAALMADGESRISNIHYIDRGYEKIDEKLRSLGADIKRVEIKD